MSNESEIKVEVVDEVFSAMIPLDENEIGFLNEMTKAQLNFSVNKVKFTGEDAEEVARQQEYHKLFCSMLDGILEKFGGVLEEFKKERDKNAPAPAPESEEEPRAKLQVVPDGVH